MLPDGPEVLTGLPFDGLLPRPATAPAIPLDGNDRLEVDPGGATVGVLGRPAIVGAPVDANTALAAVSVADVPGAVKARLTSAEHRAFIERCQPAALALRNWRRTMAASPGAPKSLDAALAGLDDAGQREMAAAFRGYAAACLRPLDRVVDARLRGFIASRVGLIRTAGGAPLCTATLLTPTAILTARHCVSSPSDELAVRDLRILTFALAGSPATEIPLTMQTVRTEYYRDRPRLGFDRNELQSDMVIVVLARPAEGGAGSSAEPLTIAAAERYAPLIAVTFNLYSFRAAEILDGTAAWHEHIYFDPSATCLAAGRFGERLVLHACQTEGASSGSPLLILEDGNGPITLAAVHTGGFSRLIRHSEIWSDLQIDTQLVPNHAVSVTGRVRDRIAAWADTVKP